MVVQSLGRCIKWSNNVKHRNKVIVSSNFFCVIVELPTFPLFFHSFSSVNYHVFLHPSSIAMLTLQHLNFVYRSHLVRLCPVYLLYFSIDIPLLVSLCLTQKFGCFFHGVSYNSPVNYSICKHLSQCYIIVSFMHSKIGASWAWSLYIAHEYI